MITPLRYDASVEVPEKDEAKTQAELIEQLLKISKTTRTDEKEALRSVHAKSHGLLQATVSILENPPELAQGLFAKPGKYDAVMRFSTSPGDLLPDSVSTPRGLALRVLDVEGASLPDSHPGVQDFLLVTGKAFSAPDAKHFAANLKLLAGTTDKAEGLKVALSAALRAAESALESVGGESATFKSLGGYPETHILGESFFSQVPVRFGDYIAKIGVVPVSPELTALTDLPLDLNEEFDALRQAVRGFFAAHGGVWEIRAQLCTNLKDMPVEDASKPWPEDKSPYVTVARIEAAPQESYGDEQVAAIDKATAFSPWNGLDAHRPLGSINRVRKAAYEASARFRLSANGCPFHAAAAE
jgi:hypothetical protein